VSREIHVRIRACNFCSTANLQAPTLEFNIALPSPRAFIFNIISASPAAIQPEGASSFLITNLISISFSKPENCLMGVGKHGNQVYVTDLGLATKRRAAQVKATAGRSLNSKLAETARFASVNGHLGIGEYNVLGSCDSKANSFPSAAPVWARIAEFTARQV
jgi:hypothetical protein